MSRVEFTKPTKRLALKRSGMKCEATGAIYGLPPGQRCNAPLALGVRFEHVDPDANSKDNSLENCDCVCPKCWRWKTDHYDKPLIAKTNRQRDKHLGITRPKRKMQSRGFDKTRTRHMDGSVTKR